ncbi:hypothetical protein D915_001216 [Fasciola hepatica]|uniref:Uncharacterized protein n=1 Tax=Fasciola hepatica TaxID=6192 RepID=A0A2H1CSM1_FASHE|nr:hypothetical protein D915_001216 [Fasciola hepatica]
MSFFFCFSALVFLMHQIGSTPMGAFDPQAELMRQEYITSLRVDSALDRCIHRLSAQANQRFRKSIGPSNGARMNSFSQMEQLRQCMLQEFAGKVSSHRWNSLDGLV